LLTLLFWFQIGPILESRRHWVSEIIDRAESRQDEDQPESLLLYHPDSSAWFPSLAVYGLDQLRKVEILPTREAVQSAAAGPAGILILEKTTAGQMNIPLTADTISGWNDQLEAVSYQLTGPK
jgi:hypothetical protein